MARLRIPKPLDVTLRQHHRGVETDDREATGDEDGLDDRFADLRLEVVELGSVVRGYDVPSLPW